MQWYLASSTKKIEPELANISYTCTAGHECFSSLASESHFTKSVDLHTCKTSDFGALVYLLESLIQSTPVGQHLFIPSTTAVSDTVANKWRTPAEVLKSGLPPRAPSRIVFAARCDARRVAANLVRSRSSLLFADTQCA